MVPHRVCRVCRVGVGVRVGRLGRHSGARHLVLQFGQVIERARLHRAPFLRHLGLEGVLPRRWSSILLTTVCAALSQFFARVGQNGAGQQGGDGSAGSHLAGPMLGIKQGQSAVDEDPRLLGFRGVVVLHGNEVAESRHRKRSVPQIVIGLK